MKSIKQLLVLSLMITLAITSYGQSSISPVLSEKDKQVSVQFKSLQGQDRVAAFQQLQHLVRVKAIDKTNPKVESSLIGAKATTVNDLITLLGNPTSRVNQTMLIYSLKGTTNSCKLVVGIDKEGYVVFCTIKDCQ